MESSIGSQLVQEAETDFEYILKKKIREAVEKGATLADIWKLQESPAYRILAAVPLKDLLAGVGLARPSRAKPTPLEIEKAREPILEALKEAKEAGLTFKELQRTLPLLPENVILGTLDALLSQGLLIATGKTSAKTYQVS